MMYSSLVDDLMHFKKFAMDSDFENNEFRQWEIKELKELEANLREKGMEEQANKLNGVLCSMVDQDESSKVKWLLLENKSSGLERH